MTREEALKNLNLSPEADSEAIEKAYQRLARRYPPEFQPEKFRIIDESYRQLTSLPEMLDRLLSPNAAEEHFDPDLLILDPPAPSERLDEAIAEVRAEIVSDFLWRLPASPKNQKGKIPF
jgi:hypothetical protein